MELKENENLYKSITQLLNEAKQKIIIAINNTMVLTYFEIGKMIVEEEQKGNKNAEYGTFIIESLSQKLTIEFGKGFSKRNLELIRQFYLNYKNTKSMISQNLSWTHYITLMRITNIDERNFYEIECINNAWSVRELNRHFNSGLYERLTLSKDKESISKLAKQGQIIEISNDIIKDPYILEFLNLPEHSHYNESDLEQELINKLEHFLLELGKGFSFVGRQVRFTFDEEHFRVDLVFYNRFLRCFVLIDLKIGKLKHQDLGQMQMYVNYYDRFVKTEEENATIGIILCKDKKDALVEITLPKDNTQIFASRYLTYIPSKEDLIKLINE